MITISTNTRRFTIKAEEEQCERMFGKLVMELLEAAGGNFQEAKGNNRKAETAEGGGVMKCPNLHGSQKKNNCTKDSCTYGVRSAGQKKDFALKMAQTT